MTSKSIQQMNKKSKALQPRPRLTRFCHSKNDEVSCQSFLAFIKRYDQRTAKQIIEEALLPDIADARTHNIFGHRTALKSALQNFTQKDFVCNVLSVPMNRHNKLVKIKEIDTNLQSQQMEQKKLQLQAQILESDENINQQMNN